MIANQQLEQIVASLNTVNSMLMMGVYRWEYSSEQERELQ